MRKITQLEYSLIDSKVKSYCSNNQKKDISLCFLELILQLVFPRSEEEISSLITDGGMDRGADAIHIRETDNTAEISIVQCKYARSLESASKNFPGKEIDKLISLITDIINQSEGLSSTVNPILSEKITDIWQLVSKGKMLSIKIFLISNMLPLIEHERKRLDVFCKQFDFITFEQMSFYSISSLIASDQRPKENGILKAIEKQAYDRSDYDIRGLVANIDANSYVDMITNENGEVERHLFDENIRGYLGAEGGFNKQILDSALSDDNHLFWYLNNGITIIADDFTYQNVRGSAINLTDFQIVNGAQTSYSLSRAKKVDPNKLDDLIILVKIFASSREDISQKIAIATNSQARISPRDLKANDEIQKRISSIFSDNNILYERKRNQFERSQNKLRIDSLKLGQSILAYQLERPHKAKTESDEIFGNLYTEIFSEKLDADYLIRLASLYIHVSHQREEQLGILRTNPTFDNLDQSVGYTQWHILYCIRLLCKQDNKDIPEISEFDQYLERAQKIISKIAGDHSSQSYYRVFRSAKTVELISQALGGSGQLNFEF